MLNTLSALSAILATITLFALTGIVVLMFGWAVVFTVTAVIDKIKEIRK